MATPNPTHASDRGGTASGRWGFPAKSIRVRSRRCCGGRSRTASRSSSTPSSTSITPSPSATPALVRVVPAGGFDLDHVAGPLDLRLTGAGDRFTALDAEAPAAVPPGEVAYADGA